MNEKVLDPIGKHFALALDGMGFPKAIKMAAMCGNQVAILKTNNLVANRGAANVVEALSALVSGGVWCDLKTYDTDGTMENTIADIQSNGARIASVHLLNSRSALTKALEAAGNTCCLTGITILTSYKEEEVIELFGKPSSELVPMLVKRARALGFKSIVCSAVELPVLIEQGLLDGIVPIIPGTRSLTTIDKTKLKPQQKTASTEGVLELLASFKIEGIVVLGSEVYTAPDPAKKLAEIRVSIQKRLDENGCLKLESKIPLLEQ